MLRADSVLALLVGKTDLVDFDFAKNVNPALVEELATCHLKVAVLIATRCGTGR